MTVKVRAAVETCYTHFVSPLKCWIMSSSAPASSRMTQKSLTVSASLTGSPVWPSMWLHDNDMKPFYSIGVVTAIRTVVPPHSKP